MSDYLENAFEDCRFIQLFKKSLRDVLKVAGMNNLLVDSPSFYLDHFVMSGGSQRERLPSINLHSKYTSDKPIISLPLPGED